MQRKDCTYDGRLLPSHKSQGGAGTQIAGLLRYHPASGAIQKLTFSGTLLGNTLVLQGRADVA